MRDSGRLAGVGPAQNDPKFDAFLRSIRAEALKAGVDAGTLDMALGKVQEIPRVMELARNQPEFKMTFDRYLEIVVSDERVKNGRARLAENRALVDRFAGPAGIPPSTVVALWGIESNYGTRLGDFEVIDALATLVYNNFRAQFFRQQLMAALKILAQGHVGLRRHEGLVGGRDGPVPVHPDELPRLCRRRRRRRPHGHLDQQGRRLRLDRATTCGASAGSPA